MTSAVAVGLSLDLSARVRPAVGVVCLVLFLHRAWSDSPLNTL